MGQKRTRDYSRPMSAYPSRPDIAAALHLCSVPLADIIVRAEQACRLLHRPRRKRVSLHADHAEADHFEKRIQLRSLGMAQKHQYINCYLRRYLRFYLQV
jgi:hypothetical protein